MIVVKTYWSDVGEEFPKISHPKSAMRCEISYVSRLWVQKDE